MLKAWNTISSTDSEDSFRRLDFATYDQPTIALIRSRHLRGNLVIRMLNPDNIIYENTSCCERFRGSRFWIQRGSRIVGENALGWMKKPLRRLPYISTGKQGYLVFLFMSNERPKVSEWKSLENSTKSFLLASQDRQRTHQDICPLPWRGVGKPQSQYLFIQICQDEVGKVKHLTVYSKF